MWRAIAKPAAAALVLIARVVKPQESLEHLLVVDGRMPVRHRPPLR
jgi:hypothetical protein